MKMLVRRLVAIAAKAAVITIQLVQAGKASKLVHMVFTANESAALTVQAGTKH